MRPLRGIAFKLASVMVFIVMASLIKSTADHVPAGQTVFFRSFFAIPVIFAWLAFRRELPGGLRTRNPFGHFWRGLMGTGLLYKEIAIRLDISIETVKRHCFNIYQKLHVSNRSEAIHKYHSNHH